MILSIGNKAIKNKEKIFTFFALLALIVTPLVFSLLH